MTQRKTEIARTTTIHVEKPIDTSQLDARYRLARYVLPDNFVTARIDYKKKWARLHNGIKEQLDAPYKVYTHDELDGFKQWALYVVYLTDDYDNTAIIPALKFEDNELIGRWLSFDEPKYHVVIKLLQIAFSHNTESKHKKRFVGQDNCYVYAKRRSKSSNYHICLKIEMKGDTQDEKVFYVYGQAETFLRVEKLNPKYTATTTYYSITDQFAEKMQFAEVKSSAVSQTSQLYRQNTFPGSKTQLKFHQDSDEVEEGRGYLVDQFIKDFAEYLRSFGFTVEHISRDFTKYPIGNIQDYKLSLNLLGKVLLYDARFKQSESLSIIEGLLDKRYGSLIFEWVTELDEQSDYPIIVFQDVEKRVFDKNRPLEGAEDPHQTLYEQYTHLPKQFINVNDNTLVKGMTRDEYLTYNVETPGKNQLDMIMNQLFLKDCVLRQRDVIERLPLAPQNMIFIHKRTNGSGKSAISYEVALYFEDNVAKFLDIDGSIDDRDKFYQLVDELGVEWDDCYEEMSQHYPKRNVRNYYVIVGAGYFVEIGDPNEALLYEYETIIKRTQEYQQRFEVNDLKLAHKYDDIIDDEKLSEDWLQMGGYLANTNSREYKVPKTNSMQGAVDLYHALHEYDLFLDSLKPRYPSGVSFAMLKTQNELTNRVDEIFGSVRKLQNHYKKIERFQGTRQNDVIPIYQGIWYTDDNRYVVGDYHSISDDQATANRVRQFIVYQGEEHFDIDMMLEAMSVRFIRLKQYTVYPYYFHLIGLYIDNYLKYS